MTSEMTSSASPNGPMRQTTRPEPGQLYLYVARGTPNSIRAERNLRAALDELGHGDDALQLKVMDVSKHVKHALSDGVIVTPTLIGRGRNERHTILGDLSDTTKLSLFLKTLREA
jgi:hypothetical protein